MEKMVAVVTGGTGGIGTAICQSLAKNYQVVACYYHHGQHDIAREWQEQQRAAGRAIDILYANITQFTDCAQLAATITERYGHIDVLVNNAGISADSTLKKMTPEQWQQVLDTNVTGVFNITRNILPIMLERNYGRIISIASINGLKGQIGLCNYAASKAALYGFTKSLALEVASHGITANTISPGYIATHMISSLKEEILTGIINAIPVQRLGQPEEVAACVAFLAEPSSGFITGSNIDINGGQYMS